MCIKIIIVKLLRQPIQAFKEFYFYRLFSLVSSLFFKTENKLENVKKSLKSICLTRTYRKTSPTT